MRLSMVGAPLIGADIRVGTIGHSITLTTEGNSMKTLLVVSDHDREVIGTALRHVGCETITIVRTPDEIGALRESYEIAVVQVYHGDPRSVPKALGKDDTIGLESIELINRLFPSCPILAITDSRIGGDWELARQAGADWFQSVNWGVEVTASQILGNQLDHAKNRREERLSNTA